MRESRHDGIGGRGRVLGTSLCLGKMPARHEHRGKIYCGWLVLAYLGMNHMPELFCATSWSYPWYAHARYSDFADYKLRLYTAWTLGLSVVSIGQHPCRLMHLLRKTGTRHFDMRTFAKTTTQPVAVLCKAPSVLWEKAGKTGYTAI